MCSVGLSWKRSQFILPNWAPANSSPRWWWINIIKLGKMETSDALGSVGTNTREGKDKTRKLGCKSSKWGRLNMKENGMEAGKVGKLLGCLWNFFFQWKKWGQNFRNGLGKLLGAFLEEGNSPQFGNVVSIESRHFRDCSVWDWGQNSLGINLGLTTRGEIPSTSHYPVWISILECPPVSVFGKAKSLDWSVAGRI